MMDDAIENLIQEIRCFQQSESAHQDTEGDEFVVVHKDSVHFWSRVFIKHFLFNYQAPNARLGDDLLFFVRKQTFKNNVMRSFGLSFAQCLTKIDVYRASSKQLPLKEADIEWEETLYLNLIMQKFEYTLVVAVCTRTAAEQIEILRKHCLSVYPSPSKRSMESKGNQEVITYPDIYFSIDNYEELIKQIEVHDGEWLSMELVYKTVGTGDKYPLFQGNIDYVALHNKALSNIKDNTVSFRSNWSLNAHYQKNVATLYFRARGSDKSGIAEIALNQINKMDIELLSGRTKSSLSLNDYEWDVSIQSLKKERDQEADPATTECCVICPSCTKRRMSEPGSSWEDMIKDWGKVRVRKSNSENLKKNYFSKDIIESADLKEELDRDEHKGEWHKPGYTQYYFDRKQERQNSNPSFQCFPTYISLNCTLIARELISPSKRSYLLF